MSAGDLVPMDGADGTVDTLTGEIVADCTPAQAQNVTDQIVKSVQRAWGGIKLAYEKRAWAALGFESWDAYCVASFKTPIMIPREERAEAVQSLRDAGLSLRNISAATGLGLGTLHRASVPNGTPKAPEDRGEGEPAPASGDTLAAPDPASENAEANAAGDAGGQPEADDFASGAAGSVPPADPAAEDEPNPLTVALEARKKLNAAMRAIDLAAAVPLMDADMRMSFAGTLAAVQDWVNAGCDELENAPGLTLVQGAAS